jgi:nitrogenase molybdenum-iron protein beta chain
MGAIQALLGVRGAMPIIHGSQGCSTYMRFQLCRHYREPVNVASTSMNEGTVVYGGENNLIKALKTIFEEYDPSMVGVVSSCLTETIGDDIPGIIRKFKISNPEFKEKPIIPISTPSYAGSHIEGYDKAVLSLIENLATYDHSISEKNENDKINIVPGIISPADITEIKNLIIEIGTKATCITDISESLNTPLNGEVSFLPSKGTDVEDIKDSANASGTISLSNHAESAGKYLEKKFGVRSISCPLPIGIQNTDNFINSICNLTGHDVPENVENDRGRLLDAIIDAHAYNYKRRFAVFGDPDIVCGITRFLSEMGLIPTVVCTGIKSKRFICEINKISEENDHSPVVMAGGDLFDLHQELKRTGADILIGNSYGSRIATEEEIPLFRLGFPVFDRIGAQRISIAGYRGGTRFVDSITNIVLERYYDESGYEN